MDTGYPVLLFVHLTVVWLLFLQKTFGASAALRRGAPKLEAVMEQSLHRHSEDMRRR